MRHFWTPEEDALLREHYAKGAAAIAAALPGRTWPAVQVRAARIGATTERHWSAVEDDKLARNWGYAPICEVAESLGRSIDATYNRARKLGLGSGSPQGFEYIEAAARRTGFSSPCLYRILVGAGVKIRPAIGKRTHSIKRSERCYVEAVDVDDAVKAWLKTELVEIAAKRHGVAGSTLKRWLRAAVAAGMKLPREPRRGRHWRIPSAVIDEVVAARTPRPMSKVLLEKVRRVA